MVKLIVGESGEYGRQRHQRNEWVLMGICTSNLVKELKVGNDLNGCYFCIRWLNNQFGH